MTDEPGRFRARRSFANKPAPNASVARSIIERGCPIFPLALDKSPLTPHGFHDARLDDTPWLTKPEALVGIPTGPFWVLDLDPPLETSVQTICRLLRMEWRELNGKSPLTVRTPRGGYHLYWRRRPGVAVRTGSGDIGKGIDTRGHDASGRPTGYVVAPGCLLPDGRGYRIERGSLDDVL